MYKFTFQVFYEGRSNDLNPDLPYEVISCLAENAIIALQTIVFNTSNWHVTSILLTSKVKEV